MSLGVCNCCGGTVVDGICASNQCAPDKCDTCGECSNCCGCEIEIDIEEEV